MARTLRHCAKKEPEYSSDEPKQGDAHMLAIARKPDSVPAGDAPIVIVGTGPVGTRIAQELDRVACGLRVVIYGDEPSVPYNRVRLSSLLAGELKWSELIAGQNLPSGPQLAARLNCGVTHIDRARRTVRDASGGLQPYSKLVLATGSRPLVPEIPGIAQAHVYVFRDLRDAERLCARRTRSRRTAVMGGGLLGLEAARAMQRFNTEVCVVEHAARLMPRQLDEAGAACLLFHVRALGIDAVLGDPVRQVLGEGAVTGLRLRSGRVVECDTLIVAAGIRPNVELAAAAGLAVGRGVRVNDWLQTSDPDIYAAGECAEHDGEVWGLIGPGLEQAAVAAHNVAGSRARYRGSTAATRLKVLGLPVFSMGAVNEYARIDRAAESVHRDTAAGTYRKIVTERGRLIGAIALGAFPDMSRVQEMILQGRLVLPWQRWRFARSGALWPAQEPGAVTEWPAGAVVCNCTGATRGEISRACAAGCRTVEQVALATRASSVCGSCRPLVAELAGAGPLEPVRGWKVLLGTSSFALKAALLIALVIGVPYAATVQVPWQWDVLWRESFWKQASGFTVLGLTVLLAVMSLRKRIRRFTLGDFPLWRIAHVVLGALTLAGLAVHTGGRLGSNLNFMLMASFLSVVAVGAVAGGAIALEHRLGAGAARLRRSGLWSHILIAWPIPVLLALHVFKTYYY
jgi:nitrite reductase (NADH) large subunit